MDLKAQSTYTSKTIKNFIVTPSGRFVDENGNTVTVSNVNQYLTDKKEFLQEVANGTLGTSTDPRFVVRSLNYTDTDEKSKTKDPDYVNNFDHLVLENIPTNLSPADLQKLQTVVAKTFGQLDMFFVADKRPYLYTGKRQVLTRFDNMGNGTQENHLHILVNRHSIANRSDLVNELQFCNDPEKSKALQKAIDNSIGKDKVLMQSCDFTNDNYVSKFTLELLNKNLIANGLSPLTHYTLADGRSSSNQAVSQQTKLLTKEIQEEQYTPEIVDKVIAKATEEKSYSLDSVIIQKRLNTNNSKINELTEELKRLASESRMLEEAQQTVNDNITLKQEIQNKNDVIEDLNGQLLAKNHIAEQLEERNKDLQNKVSGIYEAFEIPLDSDLKDGIQHILEQKDNDYSTLDEELKAVNGELKTEKENHNKTKEEKAKAEEQNKVMADELESVKLENSNLATQLTKEQSLNATLNKSVESMEKVNASVSKHNEALEIQLAETRTTNSNLNGVNNALKAEIAKLKQDHENQLKEYKAEKEKAEKSLKEEQAKVSKLEKENNEFRAFATTFFNEVGTKIKNLAKALSGYGKTLDTPEKKAEFKGIADNASSLVKSFQDKFNKPQDNSHSDNDPNKPKFKK